MFLHFYQVSQMNNQKTVNRANVLDTIHAIYYGVIICGVDHHMG
jgi:hypothetical protein